MGHGHFSIFTTDALGGGTAAGAWGVGSGSAPSAGATWRGVMIGATRNDAPDLLQGDATVAYDGGSTVDVDFTNILNLDLEAPHSVPSVSFASVPVTADGRWALGDDGSAEFIRGGFAGPGHEEVGGIFWTSDMTGAYGGVRE